VLSGRARTIAGVYGGLVYIRPARVEVALLNTLVGEVNGVS